MYTEDSLHVNVWMPAGEPPVGGWPVYAFIHGGWLSVGNGNHQPKNDPINLIDSEGGNVQIVYVAISYRLSLFVSPPPLTFLFYHTH